MGAVETTSDRHDSRGVLLRQLQRQLEQGVSSSLPPAPCSPLSSGSAAIDRLLPGGGLRHGMLVEWVGGESGRAEEQKNTRAVEQKRGGGGSTALPLYCSSFTLSLLAAREACREGGVLVVIDREGTFYPPGAAAWGVDLHRLIVVRPACGRDQLWAAVQSLRSPAVAAVWTAIERLDDRAFRRLQLAAQAGRTLGLLVRPAGARGEPSWADVRLGVGNCGLRIADCGLWESIRNSYRCVQVRVLRCRHGRAGGAAWLGIDDTAHLVREVKVDHDTHPVPVAAELADSAGARGAG
jgi:hypothetical protein